MTGRARLVERGVDPRIDAAREVLSEAYGGRVKVDVRVEGPEGLLRIEVWQIDPVRPICNTCSLATLARLAEVLATSSVEFSGDTIPSDFAIPPGAELATGQFRIPDFVFGDAVASASPPGQERLRSLARLAVATYGPEAQRRQTIEECGELIVALCHDARGRLDPADVATEVADVIIMAEQMRAMLPEGLVDTELSEKLDRLEARLNPRPAAVTSEKNQ